MTLFIFMLTCLTAGVRLPLLRSLDQLGESPSMIILE
jgi:hypothetical protein